MTLEEIGEVLRHARRARGLTQAQAAELAGTSFRLWNEMENGKRDHVSLTTMLTMLRLVRVRVQLVDDIDTIPSHAKEPPAATRQPTPQAPYTAPVPTLPPEPEGGTAATGTGSRRRPLTMEEALAGLRPEPMTREEWAAMAAASTPARASAPAPRRVVAAAAVIKATVRPTPGVPPLQARAVEMLRNGASTYRVARKLQLPFDVVFRWQQDAMPGRAA